jgi:glucose-1-phosphate cytidylyltransferase
MLTDLTAVLLCGGKGERLRPFTDAVPKPLVELNGRPILYHLMHYLAWSGVRRFVLCVGYRAEMVREFARSLPAEWNVECVDSGDASMTDRLLDARRYLAGRFLVCYGDTLANVDLPRLLDEHQRARLAVSLTVFPLQSPYGIVDLGPEDRVAGFREKPRLPHWINIGFMACEPSAFEFISRGRDMPDFLSCVAAAGQLRAHRHEDRHLTVNTQKDLAQAEIEIREFYTLPSENEHA